MPANTSNVARATHKTQAGAFVDVVNFSYAGRSLVIVNRGTVDIYWTYSGSGTAPDPAVGGDDTYCVPAGQTRYYDQATGVKQVKLIGTGMVYSVEVY